jgi:P-type Ca2+ transporter type 2C
VQRINIWNLVVGDIINLVPGDIIPADCLVIKASEDFIVNESTKDRNEDFKKSLQDDPFLFSETVVIDGTCKACVACVGQFSTRPMVEPKLDTETKTPLQESLTGLSKTFTFIGLIMCILILIVSLVITFIYGAVDEEVNGRDVVKKVMDCITLSVILLIVAIPEGLPMVVTVSLAFSVLRMYEKDGVLVKDLNAPEILGQATEILIGKTGTITTENMTVKAFYAQDCSCKNTRPDTLLHSKMTD